METALREWLAGVRRLLTGPMSLERLLVLVTGIALLAAIAALWLAAGGLLREQADDEALARVRFAGLAARDGIRRSSEDALTAARLLAGRPTLERLLREANRPQLRLFLQRFCDTAGVDACAVVGPAGPLATTLAAVHWDAAAVAAAEQGERFMFGGPAPLAGQFGAIAPVPGSADTRVILVQFLDEDLERALSRQAGVEVRLEPLTDWLEAIEPGVKGLHAEALAGGTTAAVELKDRGLYVSSTPLLAVTGEGIALIEARLPSAQIDRSVDRLVRRLAWISTALAVLGLIAALAVARRYGKPLQALAASAEGMGRGDFSAAMPVAGTQEVAALARALDDMRRNLIDLTGTLRRREAEAQALLQGVVEGVFAVDDDRRIRYMNTQAERMIGVTAAEAAGRFCGDVLQPVASAGSRPCDVACPILAARAAGKAQATELLRCGDRHSTVVITSAAAADGVQVQVMRDETELEAVRRARDSVLANISHEFRTPLAAQLASIELMLDGLDDMPREKVGELLHALQRGTLRVTWLIDNLLESVRIESGQTGIRHQAVLLAQVVEDAQGLLEGLLAQRRQSLQVELPADLPVIEGDPQRLTQVMTNLIANASKFGPEGSDISVGGALRGDTVHIWVEDTGPGLPPGEEGSVFERFYRAAEAEPEPRGLGLGLWIVKSIVERHGGTVGACRTSESRTRFEVRLPTGKLVP